MVLACQLGFCKNRMNLSVANAMQHGSNDGRRGTLESGGVRRAVKGVLLYRTVGKSLLLAEVL